MLGVWLLTVALAAGDKPKLMVLDLAPAAGIEEKVTGSFTSAVATEIAARGFFEVLTAGDVRTVLGVERQRQLLGCSETSCLSELAGAMGARFVLSGQVGKVGDVYQLNLEALDSIKARPLGRSTRLAKDLRTLSGQIPFAVAEATGTPLPPPPSRWLPYSIIALGGAGVLAGGYLGVDGISREGQINATLQEGRNRQAPLATMAFYQRQASAAASQKTASLAVLGCGAALVALGLVLNPSEGEPRIALAPTANGFALAGAWR